MSKQENRLDESKARFLTGEGDLQGEFAAYEADLTALKALRDNFPRNESRAAAARNAYLQKARLLPRPVSAAAFPRHKGWMHKQRKENSTMRTLARSLLILALALGGTGATAFAAQSSMPDDVLYPVKLFTEDVRLSLTNDPMDEFNILVDLAEERSREVTGLTKQGLPVPQEVTLRLQTHLNQALNQAGQMDEPAMIQAMQQIQTMAQFQFQVMEQTRSQTQSQEGGELGKAQQTMFEMQRAAQGALENPAIFRNQQGQGIGRPETAPDGPEILPPQGNSAGGQGQGTGKGSGGQGGKDGSDDVDCVEVDGDCDPLLIGTLMPDGTYYYPYLRGRGYGRYW